MFQAVFKRAEAVFGNIVDQALARALVAIPLVVAIGFATAAASTHLTAKYGAVTGYLVLAGVFTLIGLLAAVYVSAASAPADAGTLHQEAGAVPTDATGTDQTAFGDVERELIFSTLAAAVPLAAPQLMRGLIRNLPLVLIVLIVAFVLTRKGTKDGEASNTGNDEENAREGSDQTAQSMPHAMAA